MSAKPLFDPEFRWTQRGDGQLDLNWLMRYLKRKLGSPCNMDEAKRIRQIMEEEHTYDFIFDSSQMLKFRANQKIFPPGRFPMPHVYDTIASVYNDILEMGGCERLETETAITELRGYLTEIDPDRMEELVSNTEEDIWALLTLVLQLWVHLGDTSK